MEIEYILSDFRGMFDFVAVTLSSLHSSLLTLYTAGELSSHISETSTGSSHHLCLISGLTKSSSMVMHLKIVTAGPRATGKTTISNFIAGHVDRLDPPETYSPTFGVRILEFQPTVSGVNEEINVEIWDMSGDQIYESCWKAVIQDADGVILVYNPDAPAQDQQVGDWFEYFVKRHGLRDDQCIVLAHRVNAEAKSGKFRPPPLFSKVTAAMTTPQSAEDVKSIFENFLKEIHSMKRRK